MTEEEARTDITNPREENPREENPREENPREENPREENRAALDRMIDGHIVSPDSPEVIRTGLYYVDGRGVLIVTADGHKCNNRLGLIQKAVQALARAPLQ